MDDLGGSLVHFIVGLMDTQHNRHLNLCDAAV
eukprot:COSAG01_NODE_76773_length_177_cov_309.692308_2_plen_31_part_01